MSRCRGSRQWFLRLGAENSAPAPGTQASDPAARPGVFGRKRRAQARGGSASVEEFKHLVRLAHKGGPPIVIAKQHATFGPGMIFVSRGKLLRFTRADKDDSGITAFVLNSITGMDLLA